MQALNASNAVGSCPDPTLVENDKCRGNLPMINHKKSSEFLETSLIYLLSTAVAVGAFVLVWLISLLLGPSQT
jgi:hypothetical protein